MVRDLDVARHELCRRIAVLDARAARARAAELAAAVDEIRAIARGAGLVPAVTVAQFVAAALARGEGVRAWLEMLRDAVGCERQDEAARAAFAAACSVRLAA